MGLITRKYGPLPGWAWAAVAAGAAFLVFYFRGRSSSAAPAPGGSVLNNPAASSIPFVPSVTVTGIPPGTQQPSTPTPTTPGTGQLVVTPGPYAPPGGTFLRTTSQEPFSGGIFVPSGTRLTQSGAPVNTQDKTLGQVPMIPVTYLGGSYWVSSYDVTPASGSGGWGQSGAMAPLGVGAVGAWTVGWQPVPGGRGDGTGEGGGGSSKVNRTGVARRAGRLFGGQGGGAGGQGRSGHPAAANSPGRVLRRRSLSGR